MLYKKYLNALRSDLHTYALIRRDIIKQSDDALHHAKRAVFALQRGEESEAQEKLRQTEILLAGIQKKYRKNLRVQAEGAFRAALEEYVEATLLHQFVTTGSIGKIKQLAIDGEVYLAGLCDVPGELYRYAIAAATKGEVELVKRCAEMGLEIVGELIEFNLTSYLRTKFDQAKQAVHKLEKVVYDVSLRR